MSYKDNILTHFFIDINHILYKIRKISYIENRVNLRYFFCFRKVAVEQGWIRMVRAKYQTKSDIVYHALKEDIINGEYKPGQRIIAARVAKKFGFSEIPVREALKHLESEGIIQNKPHVGAVVTSLEVEDFEKLLQVRLTLEGLATRLAAAIIEEKDLKRLEKMIIKMEKVIRDKNYEKLPPLNYEFHRTICAACGNEYLYKIIFEIWDLSFRNPGVFAFAPERAIQSLPEHKAILKALKKRDGISAEKLVLEQKESTLKAFRLIFKETKPKSA